MLWCLRFFGGFLMLITLLPFVSTGKWYVRWWDFPRFQIAVLLVFPSAVFAAAALGQTWEITSAEALVWTVSLTIALVWQLSHVIPFSPLWPKEVVETASESPTFRVMVANLDYENKKADAVERELAASMPDVLLLIEYDKKWQDRLASLHQKFSFHHEEVRGEGLGIALWSNVPLSRAETRFLVSDRRASIWSTVELPNGNHFNLVAVHPTPPGLLDSTGEERRDSRIRDAELILIAHSIAERSDEAWVVAGDFNDVAWSHTTRLFKRISGLHDPRIGRSFMGTYIAQYPPLRCPIDHVFLSDGFSVADLSRQRITGSDHFAVLAELHLATNVGVTPEPEGNDRADATAIIDEGRRDAAERGVADTD